MYLASLTIPCRKPYSKALNDAVWDLCYSYQRAGQSLNTDPFVGFAEREFRVNFLVPERDALSLKYATRFVKRHLRGFSKIGLGQPKVKIVGPSNGGMARHQCKFPSCYVLFTHFNDETSPVCCGDCYLPIPLYRLPRERTTSYKLSDGTPFVDGGDYWHLLKWQSTYRHVDSLWMGSSAGEEFARRQMSDHRSALSEQGLLAAEILAERTGKPVYYYLLRYGKSTVQNDLKRRCPSCGGEWLLKQKYFNFCDFKCDKCHLISDVNENARKSSASES
jgi:predicted  nucleic acid-binding Zn ribbon protein